MKNVNISLFEPLKFSSIRRKIITFWRWIMATNIRKIVAAGLLLIVVTSLAAILITNEQKGVISSLPTSSSHEKKSIDISSEPVGITIQGPAECSETFTTPYTCQATNKTGTNLSFVAPDNAEIGDKKMIFATWEGCTASNEDKKICEVDLNKVENGNIKAVYNLIADDSPNSTKPNASTPTKPTEPDKSPLSDCPNTPDSTGVVTCKTTVYKTPFAYALEVNYPRDNQNKYYYAPVAHNPYISCTDTSVCDPVNALPNTVSNIVSGIKKPGTLFIKLLYESQTSDGKKMRFDKWKVEYDPNRFPNIDPNQHTVYFVTAYYVMVM